LQIQFDMALVIPANSQDTVNDLQRMARRIQSAHQPC